jgi:Na+/H+-translocating membrane pyrophosphatase
MILLGIAGGPSVVTGFICGATISGVQIGLSSGVSGCAWSTVKK